VELIVLEPPLILKFPISKVSVIRLSLIIYHLSSIVASLIQKVKAKSGCLPLPEVTNIVTTITLINRPQSSWQVVLSDPKCTSSN